MADRVGLRGIDDMSDLNVRNSKEKVDTPTPKIPPKRSQQIIVKTNITAGIYLGITLSAGGGTPS